MASFFFSSDHRAHRVCTTFYRLYCRSHVLVSTRFTVNPAVTGSSPCFSQKLFRAIFFGTVRLFFRIFFCRQRVPPSSFLIFCSKLKFQKAQRAPFLVFRHYETVSKISFFAFFSKIFPKNFYFF